jgi:hypothetical protein
MNMKRVCNKLIALMAVAALFGITGCANQAADLLNPYAETGGEKFGTRNNEAILGENAGSNVDERARHALEVMASYQRTHEPGPAKPVLNPAVVRLMWVPDHLNKAGDLVPAHYYYLKVRDDYWAVQDAFEMERQLHEEDGSGSSATPWVYREQ